jgi:hypothetical protein
MVLTLTYLEVGTGFLARTLVIKIYMGFSP